MACESHDHAARASSFAATSTKEPPKGKTSTLAFMRALSMGVTSAKSCEKAGEALKMNAWNGCGLQPGMGAVCSLEWVRSAAWNGCGLQPGRGAGCSLEWVRVSAWNGCGLQPGMGAGCSPEHVGLQPGVRAIAAWGACGCSPLGCVRLQPERSGHNERRRRCAPCV